MDDLDCDGSLAFGGRKLVGSYDEIVFLDGMSDKKMSKTVPSKVVSIIKQSIMEMRHLVVPDSLQSGCLKTPTIL